MQKLELLPSMVDSFAPNPSAVLNGKSLVKSQSFFDLCITPDNTLIYGKCYGSSKNPYICSMDFIDPSKPVPRCTCPSRQIPCKHVLGLMYVYAGGTGFAIADVLDDVAVKRDNLNKTAEKKEIKSKKNTTGKVNTSSAIKKIDKQLEGIEIAEKLLKNITCLGLSSIDARAAESLKNQVKEMGNFQIKGIQALFNELFLYVTEDIIKNGAYTRSVEQLIILGALVKKAKPHLEDKKLYPLLLNIDTQIEEQSM